LMRAGFGDGRTLKSSWNEMPSRSYPTSAGAHPAQGAISDCGASRECGSLAS
jgi:hypothetical protein